ncbi:hypothetical protein KIH07_21960 [Hydrogenophaga taeniospiralis]|uniref:hypothetical protein n=1 Tax=Hydrogenophaga taeniospiralis TaxID=65656 RepID=UPI001CF9FAFA|nr:hypothetical protein [Hydrogenophaga taeniospiralis]MCB4366409.1 hypothetical protein [Hydrogenophaga taeniospiralis]
MDTSAQPTGPSHKPLNRLDARVAMALSFWAYPHQNVEEARKIVEYPEPWSYATPGRDLPPDWPTAQYDASGQLTQEGWNTQHNAEGELENQFKVSINRKTHEITFDFKGSDAWSNWKSDLGNAGASEFAKIEAKAQAAYEALKNDERFKDYRFAATGHSLGGGMAQSFALKNKLDAYAYNSLPIARDTVHGDYFKDVGGFDAALERYKAAGRQVHDVRTPNDIATYTFDGVMNNRYLSGHVGPGPTQLPGSSLPTVLKTALMLSGSGTLVAGAVMGQDHANQALFDAQQGLSVDAQGRYRIPEGHADFARVPPEARKLFARLGESPVIKASCVAVSDDVSPFDRFHVRHEDGSQEHIAVNPRSGDIEIHHHDRNGQRSLIEMNGRRAQPARVTEFDAEGKPIKTETVAMREQAPEPETTGTTRVARADEAQGTGAAQSLRPEQQAQFLMAYRQTGDALQRLGLSTTQVGQVCAAAVTHCTRHGHMGAPEQFYLSRDGQRLAVMHQSQQLSEMAVAPALHQSAWAHFSEAAQIRAQVHAGDVAPSSLQLAAHPATSPSASRAMA